MRKTNAMKLEAISKMLDVVLSKPLPMCDVCGSRPATTKQGIYDTCGGCKQLVKKHAPNHGHN